MKRCFFPASTGWCAYGLIAGMVLAGWEYVSPVHGSDVRSWALQVPETETTGFEQVDPVTSGILFTNTLQEFTGASNRVLFNGAGVAVGDVNADGRPDLFLCGLEVENQLYSNLGDWQFKRMPIPDALASPGFPSRGAVFADLNADHQLDLLLTTVGGGCRAFLNLGAGLFEPMADNAGIATQGGASSVTLADVDGNATLDLYVAFNRSDDIRDYGRVNLKRRNGTIVPPADMKDRLLVHRGQLNEYGEPDALYLNDGSGNLTPVAWTGGHFRNEGKPLPSIPRDWGLSASFRDMNGDLAPDLYVCNDYWTPDRIWLNDGRGGFDALTLDSITTTSASSMGLDFADVNQDGLMDIFVVDMLSRDHVLRKRQQPALNPLFDSPAFSGKRRQIMQNTLLLQRPDATFQEVAQAAGLVASDWSWSPIFMDVDLDGDADLLVSAGYPHDVQDMDAIQRIARLQHSWERYKDPVALRKAFAEELMEHYRLYPKLDLPVMAFENRGDGSFREMTHLWGTDRPGIHQGFATGDLDGDGDRDLVLNDLNGAVLLYRNLADGPRAKVKLVGGGGNTQGIGAKLILRGSGFPPQSREVIAGGRYLSGCDTSVTFAMPDKPGAWTLEVLWRDGNVTSLPDIRSNHAYEIGPSTDLKASIDSKVPAEAFPFPTVTSIPVGDGKINGPSSPPMPQPLLPLIMRPANGNLEPADLNQDGVSDFLIGGSRGSALQLLESRTVSQWDVALASPSLPAQTAAMYPLDARQWLIAFQKKEPGMRSTLHIFDPKKNVLNPGPEGPLTTSTLAAGPLKGRGPLSVFIGAGPKEGHYPQSHASMLFTHTPPGLSRDTRNGVLLEGLGLVHDAVWSDLNQDGYPELIVAAGWSPLRVFENQRGSLYEVTEAWGFSKHKGYWMSVTTLDLNGDGKLDVVAGNLGQNTSWKASREKPFQLWYGTFSNPNVTDIIETVYHADGTLAPLRLLDDVGSSVPFFYQQVKDYRAYSEASLETLLGSRKALAFTGEAHTFTSMVFLNTGKGVFQAKSLPVDVQYGAVTDLLPGDFNGDGACDLAYVHNNIWMRPGMGDGLRPEMGMLMGDAEGGLKTVRQKNGMHASEPVQAARVGDFNRDNRTDLLLGYMDGRWVLQAAKEGPPGFALHILGSPDNPRGIGCQVRLHDTNGRWSPVFEVRSDTSQPYGKGQKMVCHASFKPSSVWVRWPGGTTRTYGLSADSPLQRIAWKPQ